MPPWDPSMQSDKYPIAPVQQAQVDDFEENRLMYYEALMGVDDSVGRVLDYLDDKGLAENTIVVYAGDNGFMWGEHGLIDKRYAYEESIRIPHLMRFPRMMPEGGRKVDEMVLNVDLAPTLLAAAGLAAPGDIQGLDCMKLACGDSTGWRDSWLYEYFGDIGFPQPPCRAVCTREWKLIEYQKSYMQIRDFPDEMYHIATDPEEKHNLAQYPEFRDIRKKLQHEMKRLSKKYS